MVAGTGSHFPAAAVDGRRGEGGGPLLRTLAMVEEEEDTAMMVVEGAINSYKDNLHQSRFQSSRGRMIQTST